MTTVLYCMFNVDVYGASVKIFFLMFSVKCIHTISAVSSTTIL